MILNHYIKIFQKLETPIELRNLIQEKMHSYPILNVLTDITFMFYQLYHGTDSFFPKFGFRTIPNYF